MRKAIAKFLGLIFGLQAKVRLSGFAPYPDTTTNTLYNLLFCDDLALFKANIDAPAQGPAATLIANPPDRAALEALAADTSHESHLRVLAYHVLRKLSVEVRKKELLGIVVDEGMDEGLRTLAAYRDGRATHIDASGKSVRWDGKDREIERKLKALFEAGEAVVAQTGPWDKKRLPAPPPGVSRISLLVSDGLYFGHAPTRILRDDPIGSTVLKLAGELAAMLPAKALSQ